MAASVKHHFVNPQSDAGDDTVTQPSDWNADHDLSGLVASDDLFDATAPATETFGDAGAVGTATTAAHRDHKHPMPNSTAGPDADITIDASGAAGTASTAARSGHGHEVATVDAPSGANITIDAAPSAAATGAIARAAHGHRMNTSSSTPQHVGTAAAGTSGHSPSRDDHVHATGAGTPSTQAFGDAAATGSGPAAAMTDHKHAMPNSTAGPDADITVDASGAAGTAASAARSGHGHKLATSSSTPAHVGTAAAGTSGHAPSRDDHVHATGAGTPTTIAFGDAAATGSGPAAAMTDHKHGFWASGQVPFPATQNASSDANTLDDYEEGTWTPTVGGTTSETGQVYSVQVGYYTKIGRVITLSGYLLLSTLGTITGNVCIKGLPFTIASGTNGGVGEMAAGWLSLSANKVYVYFQATASTTQLLAQGIGAATADSATALVQADLGASSGFRFGGQYFV